MNEKELSDIEQGLRSKIQEEWPTWEQIEQLIAEVRKLRKPLIVSSTIKKLADENKLYKDLYTKANTQNMVYKVALEKSEEALKEVMSWHGDNLQIANWHQNGDLEPLDDFIDNAGIEEALVIVLSAMHVEGDDTNE